MQSLVVTFNVACGLDMSQEAPVVLAEMTAAEPAFSLQLA